MTLSKKKGKLKVGIQNRKNKIIVGPSSEIHFPFSLSNFNSINSLSSFWFLG